MTTVTSLSECRTCERGPRATGPHSPNCTVERRFWAKIHQSGRCWIWQGSNNGRYGEVRLAKGRKVYAHRLSYEMVWGPVPDGLVVAHRCDNPLCVKPSHLFAATQAENVHDMIAKGRNRRAA